MAPCITLIFEWYVHESPDKKSVGEGCYAHQLLSGPRTNLEIWVKVATKRKARPENNR